MDRLQLEARGSGVMAPPSDHVVNIQLVFPPDIVVVLLFPCCLILLSIIKYSVDVLLGYISNVFITFNMFDYYKGCSSTWSHSLQSAQKILLYFIHRQIYCFLA